ncbi:CPBP family glutamic-type intramembrane protease [Mangrovimonas sp. ST2L15]|uniref:CPBP family glutamic-type intramembrane protease n=1 Tax=Mangrovimonas sp. ST2L15 TaxID=1645916 RepID=UPI000AE45BCD|nr:CPBP family glutamic-type intramembrane protease [Mangrovimonas sp. ST2L15]
MTLKNKKHSWLLISGIGMFCLGIVTSFFVDLNLAENYKTFESYTRVGFPLFLVFAIFIAPIFEELSFRGGFVQSKIIRAISLIGLIIFFFLTQSYLTKVITIIYLVLLIVSFFKKEVSLLVPLALLNAFLFALFHLDTDHLISWNALAGFSFRSAFAFFAIWICINFNLLKSILSHSVWNLSLVLVFSYSLFFPDETIQHYENENIHVTWSRTSKKFHGKVNFPTMNHIKATSCEASFLLKSVLWSDMTASQTDQFIPTELFMDYHFEIKLKDSTAKQPNLYQPIKQFLLDEELLMITKPEEN